MKKLLVVMLMLYPLSAVAETYQWTDEGGTVNFAEDLGKVPKKYRKKAKLVGEESGAPQITETIEPVPGKAKVDKVDEDQKGKKLYGGKDEGTWRKDFLTARYDLQQSESALADLRGRLSDTTKMSRSEYLSIQTSIKHAEGIVQQRQKKLEQLRESADRSAVPKELRQ
ncbi:MAG: hypothetical protein A2075_15285 [Geobacteraceae bacterium GWC2_58_44]|nr:MAG: hypothetical protein A2075_15285 [Geobacteraceae bacterium GWC2_58_44]HBG07316.1 DUF4124 domain-containing protein [Geobacter sp.]